MSEGPDPSPTKVDRRGLIPARSRFRIVAPERDSTRINERIRVPEIRVIGAEGEQLGVMTPEVALAQAREVGLDLVEVAPSSRPPVCRIMDYGRYKYEQKKKQKEIKAKAQKTVLKEIRFGPNTDDHDFNFKLKHAIKFLEEGAKVFRRCFSCHMVGTNAFNRTGPQLNDLFGRAAGSVDGFKYSEDMERAASGGLMWSVDNLDAFIENPKSLISRTKMRFKGIKDAEDRENLMAFLRQFSDSPANIPEAEPTLHARDPDVDPVILAIKGDPEYGVYLSGECATCHQIDGKGLEASGFPPLAGSQWVTGSEDRLIKLTLKGIYGPMEVNGKKFLRTILKFLSRTGGVIST